MANFSSLANYIATITARFNKPRRNLINEGILKQDIIDALSDSGKWAEDVRLEAQAVNANFVSRSLVTNVTIYVDGVNGNDSRTGATNNNHAQTGTVKTLERVAQLHNDKTFNLTIMIVGTLNLQADVTLIIPYLSVRINSGGVLQFSKKQIFENTVLIGEGNNRLICKSQSVSISVTYEGQLFVEGHSGKIGAGGWAYNVAQGAISLQAYSSGNVTADNPTLSIWQIDGHISIGDNATLANPGYHGLNYLTMPAARYFRNRYSGNFTLGANAIESRFIGDRTFFRQYHPTSSTDVNVSDGETVLSPTNNKLWTKRGGTIRDAMGTNFS